MWLAGGKFKVGNKIVESGERVESMSVANGVVSREQVWVVRWVESTGVASRYGCKEVYIVDFLILLIPTPLVSALFCSIIPIFCSPCKSF